MVSVVLFQVLKGFFHFLRDVRLGRFSLLKDVVYGSPNGVCFFCESSVLMAGSTLSTISVAGMLVGVTVKFNSFSSND